MSRIKNNKEHRQDIAITKVEGRIDAIEDDIKEIKFSITNHIPSQIEKNDIKAESRNKVTNDKVDAINNKILWGFIAVIASTIIIQVILKGI